MVARARGLGLLAVLAAILTIALQGHSPVTTPPAAHADSTRAHHGFGFGHVTVRSISLSGRPHCPMAVSATRYVDPLLDAMVRPERIDQGVDYAGQGALLAIGAARVTQVGTDSTGWPGAFIEYQLLEGRDAGCYVYAAEGLIPTPGLQAGATVAAGQVIARIIPHYPTGFEIGWGAGVGTKTYVALTSQWTASDDQDNIATTPGKAFSGLIAYLGGPAGKDEGGAP
jgi:hypothetical protein